MSHGGDAVPRRRNCEWKQRPVLAVVVRAAARVVPFAAAIAVGLLASRVVAQPVGVGLIAWWFAVAGSAIATLMGCQAVFRRALTFARLLDLQASFPASAPSRFRIALLATSIAGLQDRLIQTAGRDLTHETRAKRMAFGGALGVLKTHPPRYSDGALAASAALIAAMAVLTGVLLSSALQLSPSHSDERAAAPTSPTSVSDRVPPAPVFPPERPVGEGGQPISPVTPGNSAPDDGAPDSGAPDVSARGDTRPGPGVTSEAESGPASQGPTSTEVRVTAEGTGSAESLPSPPSTPPLVLSVGLTGRPDVPKAHDDDARLERDFRNRGTADEENSADEPAARSREGGCAHSHDRELAPPGQGSKSHIGSEQTDD